MESKLTVGTRVYWDNSAGRFYGHIGGTNGVNSSNGLILYAVISELGHRSWYLTANEFTVAPETWGLTSIDDE